MGGLNGGGMEGGSSDLLDLLHLLDDLIYLIYLLQPVSLHSFIQVFVEYLLYSRS